MAISIEPPSYVSLFSGCGGFDLGFHAAGYKCLAAFDNDASAVEVYNKNLPAVARVFDLTSKKFPYTDVKGADVVIAGPPCQGFSVAGKRKINDPRNKLLLQAVTIAIQISPKVIILENVAGVSSGKHKKYWDAARKRLTESGYCVSESFCNASDFGLAQLRKRRLILAVKGKSPLALSTPAAEKQTLRHVIGTVTTYVNHEVEYPETNQDLVKIASKILPGQKLCNVRKSPRSIHTWDIPEIFGHTSKRERAVLNLLLRLRRQERTRNYGDADPVSLQKLRESTSFPVKQILKSLIRKGYVRKIKKRYDLRNTFNGKFRRLQWNGLSPTVDTRFGQPRYFLHPEENRGFTVREAARIQGFPDSFEFRGARASQYRMVGNAVPPPLAHHVASAIKKILS